MASLLLKLTSNASVRGMTSLNGMQVFSVYDFLTFVCQKTDNGVYARKTFSRLTAVTKKMPDNRVHKTKRVSAQSIERCLQLKGYAVQFVRTRLRSDLINMR